LVTALRREGVATACKGRPWSLPLQDRVLLVTVYWRTNLTLRQIAPLLEVSKSAAARIIDHLGPLLALRQRKLFRKETVLIADGTLIPTRDHTVAEQSKNYRYSTNHQVVIYADTRLVVAVGKPVPGNRNDCKAWELSGAAAAVGRTTGIAGGATEAPAWSYRTDANQVRATFRPGKRTTTPPTARSVRGSSTPSPA
jgi:hypothetical protein